MRLERPAYETGPRCVYGVSTIGLHRHKMIQDLPVIFFTMTIPERTGYSKSGINATYSLGDNDGSGWRVPAGHGFRGSRSSCGLRNDFQKSSPRTTPLAQRRD